MATIIDARDWQRLCLKIEREVRAGELVKIGKGKIGSAFRYCRRGDQFTEGDDIIDARLHGMYQRLRMERNGKLSGFTWVCLCAIDYMPENLYPWATALTPDELVEFEIALDAQQDRREAGHLSDNRTKRNLRSWRISK
jgi:hypothetical protein